MYVKSVVYIMFVHKKKYVAYIIIVHDYSVYVKHVCMYISIYLYKIVRANM